MTLKKSSHKQFNSMFWQSVKSTCFFAIAAFLILLFNTSSGIDPMNMMMIYDTDKPFLGEVWHNILNNIDMATSCFMIAGVINAVILYSFATVKKNCNVVYSLGMKRREIFLSKYIAGIAPMLSGLVIAGVIEILAQPAIGYKIGPEVVKATLYLVLTWASIYTLAFTLTGAVFSFAGNPVEASIFTFIIAVAPYVIAALIENSFDIYTLGSDYFSVDKIKWNFYHPFSGLDSTIVSDVLNRELQVGFTIFDFSTAINNFAVSVIIFIIAFIRFPKRKNEIAGSWGRSKALNELCGMLCGLFAFTLITEIAVNAYVRMGNGGFFTFLVCAVAACLAYFVFRMVFGYKRKKEMRRIFKIMPIYAAVLGAFTVIFATGGFGYSSYIPDKSEIESVYVTSQLWAYNDSSNSNSSSYGLKYHNYVYSSEADMISFTDAEGVDAVRNIHSKLIEDGKIKDSAADGCGNMFKIEYVLKDESVVSRLYIETTEETAKEMIALNNLNEVKIDLDSAMHSALDRFINPNEQEENTESDDSPEDEIEYYDDEGIEYSDKDYYINGYHFPDTGEVYLYPTDMRYAHSIGIINKELFEALNEDLKVQNAKDIFFHSPEDEIGIISFGLSQTESYTAEGSMIDSYGNVYDVDGNMIEKDYSVKRNADGSYETSWNVNSYDTRTFVLTKQMTNTVKYFEKHDMLKYFKRTVSASDIKTAKTATTRELFGQKNTYSVPLFYGAYWMSETCEYYDNLAEKGRMACEDYFTMHVSNEITNKSTIQKLLDNSFVFGFCGNEYRIVEFTYNDGSRATACITEETYKAIFS